MAPHTESKKREKIRPGDVMGLVWPRDRLRARRVQELLREETRIVPLPGTPRLVAGVDAAFFDDRIVGVACLYTYPGLVLVERAHAVRKVTFPYIPGLLSFREGPALIEALGSLSSRPDVVLFDGQGIAHPRGLGIASFVGVLTGMPSIGCAKSRLVGEYDEPGPSRGSRSSLRYEGRIVGAVLRTRENVRPLFVSPGHLADIDGSVEVVMGCVRSFRLAEPVRCADIMTKELKKDPRIRSGA
ncbi:MAG: endonuclease V [Thermodesulfobacteriota bacterium]